jgi:hypothetical protein
VDTIVRLAQDSGKMSSPGAYFAPAIPCHSHECGVGGSAFKNPRIEVLSGPSQEAYDFFVVGIARQGLEEFSIAVDAAAVFRWASTGAFNDVRGTRRL